MKLNEKAARNALLIAIAEALQVLPWLDSGRAKDLRRAIADLKKAQEP